MRRLLLLLLPALLVLGACGGDDGNDVDSASSKRTTTSVAAGDTTVADAAGSGTTVAGAAGNTATTKKGAAGSSAAPAPGPQPATSAGIKATAPGTYTYKVTGTMTVGTPQKVDTTSDLKVEPLQGTDQRSTQTTQQGSTEQVLRYQADGVYLVQLELSGAVAKEFVLNPPGLAFPQPATAGKKWNWSATSTDSKTTVKSDFTVLRTESIVIGGESVQTVVVEANVVTDGDVKSTSKRTMWVSEAHRLIVRQDEKVNGTYSGFAFSGDTSSVLQSTKPA